MKFIKRVEESFLSHIADFFGVAVIALLIWTGKQITPIVFPAIEAYVSKKLLFSLLISSLVLSLILSVYIWIHSKKDKNALKLKYGIFWDKEKNPYCPSCKKPGVIYTIYTRGGGYHCIPCDKVFLLKDALGKEIYPSQVLLELK